MLWAAAAATSRGAPLAGTADVGGNGGAVFVVSVVVAVVAVVNAAFAGAAGTNDFAAAGAEAGAVTGAETGAEVRFAEKNSNCQALISKAFELLEDEEDEDDAVGGNSFICLL